MVALAPMGWDAVADLDGGGVHLAVYEEDEPCWEYWLLQLLDTTNVLAHGASPESTTRRPILSIHLSRAMRD